MKRQFVPFNNAQDNPNHSNQMLPSGDWWLAGNARPGDPTAQSEEETPPLQAIQRPATGLLSGWKSSQSLPPINGGDLSLTSMVEQDTLKQPAMQRDIQRDLQGPNTGPASQPFQPIVSHPLSPMPGANPAQPVQSVRPMPTFDSHRVGAGEGLMRGGDPCGRPQVQPINQYANAQTLQPFGPVPVPGQAPMGWQNAGYEKVVGADLSRPSPIYRPPPGQASKNRSRKKKRRFPIWARVVASILLFLLLLTGAGSYYYYTNFADPVNHIVGQSAPLLKGEDNPNQGRDSTNILSGGRINILLLGSDTDQKFQNGYLAQTDIVVTIDPATKSVGMLSIPRDLYISVPGYGMMKLDEAFYTGQTYNNGNGVGLSRLTISQDFGIPINYYAWVGLSGFMKVVDTAGGVDIDVTHPITDDVYPDDTGSHSQNADNYKRLYIAPGPQHFDGLHALEYVRSRHADLVGDFGRSARQQQVLSNLKTRLVNSDIIGRLPELARDMNGYLKTDMQILQVVELMNFARTIDPSKIQRLILSPPTYSVAGVVGTPPDTKDIFNPICAPIQQAIAKMFALGNNAKCNVQGNTNNNTPVLAQTTQTTQPEGYPQGVPPCSSCPQAIPWTSNTSWQTTSQLASMSLDGSQHFDHPNNYNDFGIRSLLDLLLMVVFESPAALQV